MKNTFKNAAIDFGGTLYRCLTDLTLSTAVSIATSECSSATGAAGTYNSVGAESGTVSGTFLADDEDILQDAELAPGMTGALTVYPYGDIEGKVSYSWTNATIDQWGLSGATSTQGTKPTNIICDGVMTIGTVPAP